MPLTDEDVGRGYESEDADPRWVLRFGAALVALLLFVGGVSLWLELRLAEGARAAYERPWPVASRRLPPAPRLEIGRTALIDQIRARDAALLESYGWVERGAGVARIPIERALEIVAKDGLPRFAPH